MRKVEYKIIFIVRKGSPIRFQATSLQLLAHVGGPFCIVNKI